VTTRHTFAGRPSTLAHLSHTLVNEQLIMLNFIADCLLYLAVLCSDIYLPFRIIFDLQLLFDITGFVKAKL